MSYHPEGPYVFQSGKKKGKAAEQVMFEDYGFLRYIFKKMKKEEKRGAVKNKLHLHLEWLLVRGEDREVKKMCPQCGQRPIQFISVQGSQRFGFSMGLPFTCCSRPECRSQMERTKVPLYLTPAFSEAMSFRYKTDQRQFLKVLKEVFEVGRLTKENAFNFFAK